MALSIKPTPSKQYKYLRNGATSTVYEVNSCIVLKRPTIKCQNDFLKEKKFFDLLAQHPPCPELVRSFLQTEDAIFLEYMNQLSLAERLQHNQIRDRTGRVLEVSCIEPYSLRTQWMSALASGIAWLESLGYAHGDLRPENILLNDKSHLKIADFDCTDLIGSYFDTCIPPYGRILGKEAGPARGTSGKLGPRTEQFALGSIFYYINYGFEVYDDCDFGPDHGPIVVDRLQKKIFPELNRFHEIDLIIGDCWHGRFTSIAHLRETIVTKFANDYRGPEAMSEMEYAVKRENCRQLLDEGILDACPQQEVY
ncbi:MAG: hypothetical protein Q9225_004508 [Loekoesia sp. 1 TL-2023]